MPASTRQRRARASSSPPAAPPRRPAVRAGPAGAGLVRIDLVMAEAGSVVDPDHGPLAVDGVEAQVVDAGAGRAAGLDAPVLAVGVVERAVRAAPPLPAGHPV